MLFTSMGLYYKYNYTEGFLLCIYLCSYICMNQKPPLKDFIPQATVKFAAYSSISILMLDLNSTSLSMVVMFTCKVSIKVFLQQSVSGFFHFLFSIHC